MRKRSKIMEEKRRALVEKERRMTPEQRLQAYVEHSRLVLEFYNAGIISEFSFCDVHSQRRIRVLPLAGHPY